MEPYVIVAVFMLPSELAVARGLLESEGIPCRTLDEFTVQVHNLYSQAIGGVKLQVPESYAARAKVLLREGGFISEEAPVEEGQRPTEHWTARIPLVGRLELPMARLMVLVAVSMAVVLVPLAWLAQPTMAERLTGGMWCIDHMLHDGEPIEPMTIGLRLEFGCGETINFRNDGSVGLPGIGTARIHGTWRYEGKRLWIEELDPAEPVYAGPFAVGVNDHYLTLRSQRTTIHCSRYSFNFLF